MVLLSTLQLIEQLTAIRSIPGTRYSASLHWPVYDYTASIGPCINRVKKKMMKISKCHQFKINYEGIRTKRAAEEEWSEWRGEDLY
ncbi:MAG: hypothetical protein ACXV2C_03555 [Candidatus Bathyarchaeia archaeon]